MSNYTLHHSRKPQGKSAARYEPITVPVRSATARLSPDAADADGGDSRRVPAVSAVRRPDNETRPAASTASPASREASPADARAGRLPVKHAETARQTTVGAATMRVNSAPEASEVVTTRWLLKRGHSLTFFGLFLFTAVLYFRPYELFPSLSSLTSLAFWIAVTTLLIFIPSQLGLEGNLTARPREVNLALLLTLTALLSIPLATDRSVAWEEFSGSFIKVIVMFIVMVNVVRTNGRLKSLIWLSFAVSCYLSYHALNDYRSGVFDSINDRVWGAIGGAFGNPNDLALHLATMVPLALALFLSTRNILAKPIYLGCMALMTAAIIVTFSRGGFLGLSAGMMVFSWKVGRRNRFLVIGGGLVLLLAFLVLAPGNYMGRLVTIFDSSLDVTGSASARSALFWRSLYTTAANPVFGVGMANFPIVGIQNQVSHNAYTQVASEMGLAALVIYCLFIVAPFKRLVRIERATTDRTPDARRLHLLAIGLQASLVTYAVSSFFGSVAYVWYVYYLIGYALCLDRLYTIYFGQAQPATLDERAYLNTSPSLPGVDLRATPHTASV